MATFPWAAATARTTGISAQNIADGAGYVGSEIDNATNLDDTLDIDVAFSCSTAPTAYSILYVYVLYAIDGTNYEDGSTSVQSMGVPMAVPARNVTTTQRVALTGIPIGPFKFKIAIWNSLGQTAVATLTARSYRRGYAA
jgi:hypothetical protein